MYTDSNYVTLVKQYSKKILHSKLFPLTSSWAISENGESTKANGMCACFSRSFVHGILYIVDRRKRGLQIPAQFHQQHFTTSRLQNFTKSQPLKVKGGDIALYGKPISELQSIAWHTRSHSVTCHLTQVNAPRLNSSEIDWYSIYLPRRNARLSWLDGW